MKQHLLVSISEVGAKQEAGFVLEPREQSYILKIVEMPGWKAGQGSSLHMSILVTPPPPLHTHTLPLCFPWWKRVICSSRLVKILWVS